ncbi:hypothetical protein BLA29_003573, partial [Euroglyphus maynei]
DYLKSLAVQRLQNKAGEPVPELTVFAIGDRILVRRKNKRDQPFIGPFQVIKKLDHTKYEVKGSSPGPTMTCHVNQMKLFVGSDPLVSIPRRGRPGSNSGAACNVIFEASDNQS